MIENRDFEDFHQMSLKEIRRYRGFTRDSLSSQVGLTPKALYAIESRRSIPKFDTAISISLVLGISLKQFAHSIGLDASLLPDDLPAAR